VVSRVRQNVDESTTHFARSAERSGVVATGEYRSASIPDPVERPGDAHENRLHPAREGGCVFRFGDPVEMVRLERELVQAKAEAFIAIGQSFDDSGAYRSSA